MGCTPAYFHWLSNSMDRSTRSYPIPDDEQERLEALYRYQILDTPPEIAFDRIADMAVRIFEVPIATVTLVDRERQWFKACHGLSREFRESHRRDAFCAYTVLGDTVMIVPDASLDERLQTSELVTSPPGIRFYAGAPLITPDGYNIGDVCIMDIEPRYGIEPEQTETLEDLADIVVDELEARRVDRRRRLSERKLRALIRGIPDAIFFENIDGEIDEVNDRFVRLFDYSHGDVVGRPAASLYASPEQHDITECEAAIDTEKSVDRETPTTTIRYLRPDGTDFVADVTRVGILSVDGELLGRLSIIREVHDDA